MIEFAGRGDLSRVDQGSHAIGQGRCEYAQWQRNARRLLFIQDARVEGLRGQPT